MITIRIVSCTRVHGCLDAAGTYYTMSTPSSSSTARSKSLANVRNPATLAPAGASDSAPNMLHIPAPMLEAAVPTAIAYALIAQTHVVEHYSIQASERSQDVLHQPWVKH